MPESKNNIIEQLSEYDVAVRLFVSLCDFLIEENREKYDSVQKEELQTLQGKIIQLKELKDIFKK
ncbi:MAG: hypothetical protein ABFD76_02445 [Smithella sp.]